MLSRRSFLRQSALASTALVLPYACLGSQQPKKKLGVALVGLGYYSTDLLAPALQLTDNCYLAGIVTGTPSKIPLWQRKYDIPDKNVYNYGNFEKMADNPDIDVVYIVLPTSMHCEYSVRAANIGKHVWCEKPMARTVEECQQIIKACQKNKVKLSIGYRMHHEPNTQTIMEYAESKPFGEQVSIKAAAGYLDGRSRHWKFEKKMGGGAMYDMGVYPLNAIRYASGMEPNSVISASHSTTRPEIYKEVDETTQFVLGFATGLQAEGKTSLGMGMNDLRVDCKKGWYGLQPFQSYNGVQGQCSDGTLLNKTIDNQQARQMDNDAMAILKDRPVLVPGEEGMRDIRIVEAIYQSAREGRQIDLT
ncbi:MAG: Gfo/Idh/MocA family oxidoreductase [Bacteroidota bacterium]